MPHTPQSARYSQNSEYLAVALTVPCARALADTDAEIQDAQRRLEELKARKASESEQRSTPTQPAPYQGTVTRGPWSLTGSIARASFDMKDWNENLASFLHNKAQGFVDYLVYTGSSGSGKLTSIGTHGHSLILPLRSIRGSDPVAASLL